VGPNDAANPRARTGPRAAIGRALDADFEPQAPDSIASSKPTQGDQDEHQAMHAHGTPHPDDRHVASHREGTQAQREGTTAAAAVAPGGADEPKADAPKQWTCTMHPEIIKPEPGRCPICGMKLVPLPEKKPSGATP
jgi:heavy metal-binding protein